LAAVEGEGIHFIYIKLIWTSVAEVVSFVSESLSRTPGMLSLELPVRAIKEVCCHVMSEGREVYRNNRRFSFINASRFVG